jgi:DNA-directed RNA polymerase specialized sigma subunit
VRLRFAEDQEFQEIAQRVGISEVAVRQALSRAIRRLRKKWVRS